MGRRREAKAPILLALGSNGHRQKRVQDPHLPAISQAKAPNRHTVRGFVVSRCSLGSVVNGWTHSKQRSPRYKARAGAHFCKALIGANSVSFGALLGVSLGKFLNDE